MKNFYKIANGPITYHVDKENRVVVAMMRHTEHLVLDYLMKMSSEGKCKEGVLIAPVPVDFDRDCGYLTMNEKYSARVICHPEDEFDPEEGKKLAKEKLMKNIRKAFSNRLRRYAKQLGEYQSGILKEVESFGKSDSFCN